LRPLKTGVLLNLIITIQKMLLKRQIRPRLFVLAEKAAMGIVFSRNAVRGYVRADEFGPKVSHHCAYTLAD
jgi:hypothetical protein